MRFFGILKMWRGWQKAFVQIAQRCIWSGWKPRKYWGSLTVCEGVSLTWLSCLKEMSFPHCMWGCIGKSPPSFIVIPVPSLYVRVYRNRNDKNNSEISSLTVCESVSILLTLWRNYDRFTHCIWWCIGNQSRKETSQLVPSLYVRLHFVNNYLFCLTLS